MENNEAIETLGVVWRLRPYRYNESLQERDDAEARQHLLTGPEPIMRHFPLSA